jgi:outer membrane immunogenic protein
MHRLIKYAAGSALLAIAAVSGAGLALADGYAAPKIAYERPADWGGFYFGVHSGYQWSSIGGSFSNGGSGTFGVDYDTWVVGGHIGYQYQFGLIVLGVEGNWDSMFRDKPGNTTCPNVALNCNVAVDDVLSIGGRVGLAQGHWMPYLTGGYANAALHYNTSLKTPFPFLSTEEARTRNGGWYIGGGFDWIVAPSWTVGLEYRHYEFDSTSVETWTTQPTQGQPIERLTQSATSDSIMSRVTWKWGREPAAVPLK